jgi:hypothetical protein
LKFFESEHVRKLAQMMSYYVKAFYEPIRAWHCAQVPQETNFIKAGQLDWKTHKSELMRRTKRQG